MRRRVVLAALIVPALVSAWAAWVVTTTYLKAPGIVAKLERAGLLAFSERDLPRERLCALLFVQDPTFYRHQGIGIASGHPGHTTVTQALGKALLFEGFSPGPLRLNKIRLMLAAWGFDRRIAKETQLRLFLNRSYFGAAGDGEILGFPAAAKSFFAKPLDELSDPEYLSLLAMLDGPNAYHVLHQPVENARRVERIRQQLPSACGEGCFQGDAPIPCGAAGVRY